MKKWRIVGWCIVLMAYGFAWGLSFSVGPFAYAAFPAFRAVAMAETLPHVASEVYSAPMERVTVSLRIEGDTYTQDICVPAPVRLLAAEFGGWSRWFCALYERGATPKEVLNAVAYPFGDGLMHTLAVYETPPVSAEVVVGGAAPRVKPHRDGYAFAPKEVFAAVAACLEGTAPAPLRLHYARAAVRTEDLLPTVSLVASFSTSFAEVPNRVHNLRLACRAVNGTVLGPGEEFSFNRVVGERTEARGYRSAKIIADGDFVEGVGGGVCQVSTTLYNAAMLAGLRQVEVHRHSLAMHYVASSRDAMVSAWSDLRFANDGPMPAYLYATINNGKVIVRIYGVEQGAISLHGTRRVIEPHRDVDEEGNPLASTEGYRLLRVGEDGVESTLTRRMGGETQLLRRNTYPRRDAVWGKETAPSEDRMGS